MVERRDMPCEPMFAGEDGWSEWIHPLPGYRMECCDCGLVHEVQFAIRGKGKVPAEPINEGEDDDALVVFRMRRAAQPLSEAREIAADLRRFAQWSMPRRALAMNSAASILESLTPNTSGGSNAS